MSAHLLRHSQRGAAVSLLIIFSYQYRGQEEAEEEEEEEEEGAIPSEADVGREEPRKVSELEACLFWGGESRVRLQITLDVGRGGALCHCGSEGYGMHDLLNVAHDLSW